jgi:protein-tyrosine phosphatase
MQVTAQSLTGRFGKEAERFALAMVRRNAVHFLASDAHDDRDRPPRLDLAHRLLASRFGSAYADQLCSENPSAVLNGGNLPEPKPPRHRRWFFL